MEAQTRQVLENAKHVCESHLEVAVDRIMQLKSQLEDAEAEKAKILERLQAIEKDLAQ